MRVRSGPGALHGSFLDFAAPHTPAGHHIPLFSWSLWGQLQGSAMALELAHSVEAAWHRQSQHTPSC